MMHNAESLTKAKELYVLFNAWHVYAIIQEKAAEIFEYWKHLHSKRNKANLNILDIRIELLWSCYLYRTMQWYFDEFENIFNRNIVLAIKRSRLCNVFLISRTFDYRSSVWLSFQIVR